MSKADRLKNEERRVELELKRYNKERVARALTSPLKKLPLGAFNIKNVMNHAESRGVAEGVVDRIVSNRQEYLTDMKVRNDTPDPQKKKKRNITRSQ